MWNWRTNESYVENIKQNFYTRFSLDMLLVAQYGNLFGINIHRSHAPVRHGE
jgi:hypothetical protein